MSVLYTNHDRAKLREKIAIAALQAIIRKRKTFETKTNDRQFQMSAAGAVAYADALIKELEE